MTPEPKSDWWKFWLSVALVFIWPLNLYAAAGRKSPVMAAAFIVMIVLNVFRIYTCRSPRFFLRMIWRALRGEV